MKQAPTGIVGGWRPRTAPKNARPHRADCRCHLCHPRRDCLVCADAGLFPKKPQPSAETDRRDGDEAEDVTLVEPVGASASETVR